MTTVPTGRTVAFQCNVCGAANELPHSAFEREGGSCAACRSTVRWRAIVHILSTELFGESLPLPRFPHRPDIAGVGLSDWEGYAVPLAERLGYTNTYYHQAIQLDITAPEPELFGRFDFVIASEVFEHVPPPVSTAFRNLRLLLRPGGVAVFSVPWGPNEEMIEHFPRLHDYEVVQTESGEWELRNITASGERETFRDLVFHGGPGATLELRAFAERPLLEEFARAGFDAVEIYRDDEPRYGIVWNVTWSLPLAARVARPK